MIYLLIANEADVRECKRDIAKRAQPSVPCIVLVSQIFSLQKISQESWTIQEKVQRGEGWGVPRIYFLRKPLSRTGNFRENKLSPLEILLTCMTPLLVDPLEFPHVLSSVPLEILCPQTPWKFLNFSALVLMNYFVVKKRVQRVPECKKTDISFHRLLKIHILHITFTKKSVHETFLLVLFI